MPTFTDLHNSNPATALTGAEFFGADQGGQTVGVTGVQIAALVNSAPAIATQVAAATAQAAVATTQAGIATTQAGVAAAQVGLATTQVGFATAQAAIVQSAVLGFPYFPTLLNASTAIGGGNVLPQGITSGTVGGTAVTAATPGTYALTPVGGSFTGVAANLVVATATTASIVIVTPGRTNTASPTAPTFANPAGATLPAGTTLTANIGSLIASGTGQYYLTSDAAGQNLLYWQNTGTSVPVAVNDPTGAQLAYPLASGLVTIKATIVADAVYLGLKQVVTGTQDGTGQVLRAAFLDASEISYAPADPLFVAGSVAANGGTISISDALYYDLGQVAFAVSDPNLLAVQVSRIDGSAPLTVAAIALKPIVCIGDSLTAGAGGTPYPTQLAALTGRTVVNLGIGGQQGYQIAGRMGAIGIPVAVSSNKIVLGANVVTTINGTAVQSCVATTSFQATNLQLLSTSADILTRSATGTCGSVHGTLTRSAAYGAGSGGVYDATATESYSFTPDAGAALPANCPAGTTFVADYAYEDSTHVFWPFRNNFADPNYLQVLAAMHARVPHRRTVLLPVTNGLFTNEYLGQYSWLNIFAIENAEANAYPSRFLNIRRLLIDTALTTLGLTPTTQDLSDIANDTAPTQLHSDQTHFTTAAYGFIASQVNNFLVSKGY